MGIAKGITEDTTEDKVIRNFIKDMVIKSC
jgi:hypothetical protein